MHLLLVDDDPIIRMTLRTVLTSDGHTVSIASDGEEALTIILDSHVDMIVSDVYMPKLDGIRLRDTIRSLPEKAHIPFLFVSGCEDGRTLEAVSDPVKEGFFKKGNPLVELLAWIKYLTTPPTKRSMNRPDAYSAQTPSRRTPGRNRDNRRPQL